MIVKELPFPYSDWTLVVHYNHWYIKVKGKLYDKRHNNEFIVFQGAHIDFYMANLKYAWNLSILKVQEILETHQHEIKINPKDPEKEESLDLETIEIDFKNGLFAYIRPSAIIYDDLQVLNGVKLHDISNDDYYFLGVISLHYSGLENATIDFSNRVKIDLFIDGMERCKQLAISIKENIIRDLTLLEDQYFPYNMKYPHGMVEKTYFKFFELESNVVPFRPHIGRPGMRNEHGSSYF